MTLDHIIDKHEACENAFFQHGRESGWNLPQMRVFGVEYRYWIASFPGILASLISNTRDREFQFFLTQILFSELGSGDAQRMHFRLFDRILLSLGIPSLEFDVEPKLPETRRLVDGMRQLYRDRDILRAMGAQYALERQAFPMIEKLYMGFKHFRQLTQLDFEYFELHLVEEPEHLRCMQECMDRCMSRPEDIERTKDGAGACLDLIAAFWRRMYRETVALEGIATSSMVAR